MDIKSSVQKRVEWIKNILAESGAKGIIYGNSGGKDCTLVGALCKLATDNVLGVIMPCQSVQNYGSDRDDALLAGKTFNIEQIEIDLTDVKIDMLNALDKELSKSIASEYSGTPAGNLANNYAGLCCAQLEKWNEAVEYLEKFDTKDDNTISPAAVGALGNAYAHTNQLDKAVDCLKKAAKMADSNSLSPIWLIQAGEILESQGKKDEALKLYKEVKQKYFNSMQYQSIDKYIERATIK